MIVRDGVTGAIRSARQLGPGRTIVAILAGHGARCRSRLFNPEFLRSKGPPVSPWPRRVRTVGPDLDTARAGA